MIGRGVRPTLTTANGTAESPTTVRKSGWLREHRSSGVFTPKVESGPVHGWLCHTASVAPPQGRGCTRSAVDVTMSGITNSATWAVSPATVPCRHSTTSRSRPAARRLKRRNSDGASASRLSGWEARIAESAAVRGAWAGAETGQDKAAMSAAAASRPNPGDMCCTIQRGWRARPAADRSCTLPHRSQYLAARRPGGAPE